MDMEPIHTLIFCEWKATDEKVPTLFGHYANVEQLVAMGREHRFTGPIPNRGDVLRYYPKGSTDKPEYYRVESVIWSFIRTGMSHARILVYPVEELRAPVRLVHPQNEEQS